MKEKSPFSLAPLRVGVVSLARETFDMDLARTNAAETRTFLTTHQTALEDELYFYPEICTGLEQLEDVLKFLKDHDCGSVVILQLTFSDGSFVCKMGEQTGLPIFFWGYTEERTGGRLRLNSLCGLNLATHGLSKLRTGTVTEQKPSYPLAYVYSTPSDQESLRTLKQFLKIEKVVARLGRSKIGLIGQRPEGFYTCDYDEGAIREKFSTEIEKIPLKSFLETVKTDQSLDTEATETMIRKTLTGVETLDEAGVTGTLRVHALMERMIAEQGYAGLAVKCWGEFFDELNCAACGALALLNHRGIPASCEADVYGTMTTLIVQWLSGSAPFLTDWVDYEKASNTAVFWHCGMAPLSLASEKFPKKAALHSNRKRPLLAEFPLKSGRVTLVRLSQGQGTLKFIAFTGEVLDKDRAYSGTSGIVRLDNDVAEVFEKVTALGVEHHYSLVYSDILSELNPLSARLGIPLQCL